MPGVSPDELKTRALTNLHNARLGDEIPGEVAEHVILSRLLALNQERDRISG